MVREGIPHSLRPYVWMRLTGAIQKKASSELSYKQIVKASSNDHLVDIQVTNECNWKM